LVRPEFALTPWKGHLDSGLCIVIGSGQPALEWAFFLVGKVIPLLTGISVSMVVGGGFTQWAELKEICKHHQVNLYRHLNAKDMAHLVSNSSLVLATAGMIVYESVVVGAPLMAYPQLPEMKAEAEWFARQQACINIEAEAWRAPLLATSINRTIQDHEKLRQISASQRHLMDGHGAQRACLLIEQWLSDELPLKLV